MNMASKMSSGAAAPLPDSAKMKDDAKVGVKDTGYTDKKGTTTANLNAMPPGENIENQENADIRTMEMKTVTTLGYPGDGWSGS